MPAVCHERLHVNHVFGLNLCEKSNDHEVKGQSHKIKKKVGVRAFGCPIASSQRMKTCGVVYLKEMIEQSDGSDYWIQKKIGKSYINSS